MLLKSLQGIRNTLKLSLFLLLTTLSLLLGGCSELITDQNVAYDANSSIPNASSALTSFEDVASYIRDNGKLPDNFIKKKDAENLGWVPSKGNLHEVAPNMSIGGDKFGNREGLLPKADGRTWYEADINYTGGRRNADRIVFSNDGLIYMTTDHYKSFTDITKEVR
ncbi:MAG: ribonuclease [Candidatus Pristimantibacillus lignocellulolyticus]|uniref:Ribonuclease n=1 Tax=Candidatus Pristimantibacillus lignocellulolyticus TaxID=2994561 RepID=A0A9J6ZFQ0_9BACL|nr:MAG: ribonuclease [Candidatus Pristimantibacillus lignocellulolyticus]